MASHTPHREQCRDCACPVDNHNILTETSDLCKCCCHQYCDCYTCMETINKKNNPDQPFSGTVSFDEVKNTCAHTPDAVLFDDPSEINNQLHVKGDFTIYKDGKLIGSFLDVVITDRKQIDNLLKAAGVGIAGVGIVDWRKLPEDPEICHACDCQPMEHCACSCHTVAISKLKETVKLINERGTLFTEEENKEVQKRLTEYIMRAN